MAGQLRQLSDGLPSRFRSWGAWFGRASLLLRFSLLSLVVLALIAGGLTAVLQRQMEHDALVQQADEVVVVLRGWLPSHLTAASLAVAPQPRHRAWWGSLAQRLMQADPHLVRIKVWDTSGRVAYSTDPAQIGQRFAIDDMLRASLQGHQSMDVSTLSASENAADRRYGALLETYLPIRAGRRVIGAYEVYSDLTVLNRRLDEARRMVWMSMAAGFVVLYASLFAIVRSASRRLVRQIREIAHLGAQAREAETLRQVDRLKDEFIGGVSHELRRPLASIKGYTASLLLPETRWNAAEQREFLQVIDEEADHLAGLIDNMLDLARLGTGSLRLVCEPLHLPALTAQVVRRMRAQAQLPPHPYEVRFPDPFPYVEGDGARISQVLLNLLENAAKYAPAGTPIIVEGQVVAGPRPDGASAPARENGHAVGTSVSLAGTVAEGSLVAVSVRDYGPGLTFEQMARVFEKFYRVDSGLTRATEGTGLGLAICRGIVEAHGGEIGVQATPGQGCTFTVTLPTSTTAAAGTPLAAVEG